MLFFMVRGYCIALTKLLAFRRDLINVIFLEYSEEGRLSSSNLGIRNIPSDVCYDEYKKQFEYRRI